MVIDFHTHAFPDAIAVRAIESLVKGNEGTYLPCSDGTLRGQQQWDLVEKHLVGLDIYLDTSMGTEYYPEEQFLRIVNAHGKDKILFGSDAPWSSAGREIESIRNMPLSQEQRDNIFYKNAAKLLGLDVI